MFAKAPLKRFNEEIGCAPPVTKYSPKFQTMSVKSEARRGCHFYKSDRFRERDTFCESDYAREQASNRLTKRLKTHFMKNLVTTNSSFVDLDEACPSLILEQLHLGLNQNPDECLISQPITEGGHALAHLNTISGDSEMDRKKLGHPENVLTQRDYQIKHLQAKSLEYSQQLKDMSRLLESEQGKLILLNDELKTQNSHMADMERRLKEVRMELEVKLQKKDQLLEEALTNAEDWQNRFEEKNEDYEKVRKNLDSHLATVEQEKADLRAVETKLRYAAVALETMSADSESWRANSEKDRQNLERLENVVADKDVTIQRLENEMLAKSRELESLDMLVQGEKSKMVHLESELASKNFALQKLVKASQHLKDQYDHRLQEKDQLLAGAAANADFWRILYESKNKDFEMATKNLETHRFALDNIKTKLDESFHSKQSDHAQLPMVQSMDLRDTKRKIERVSNQLLSSAEQIAIADQKFERIRAQIQRHISRDKFCEIWSMDAQTGKRGELEDLVKFEKQISAKVFPIRETNSRNNKSSQFKAKFGSIHFGSFRWR